jgi:hypothetical protein
MRTSLHFRVFVPELRFSADMQDIQQLPAKAFISIIFPIGKKLKK